MLGVDNLLFKSVNKGTTFTVYKGLSYVLQIALVFPVIHYMAWLQYLHCISTGDTTVLHIEPLNDFQCFITPMAPFMTMI